MCGRSVVRFRLVEGSSVVVRVKIVMYCKESLCIVVNKD